MNGRVLIAALFLSGSQLAPAQNTFIVHLDSVQFGQRGFAHSVKEVSDGYLVFGLQRWSGVQPAHLFIHKLTMNGAPLFQAEYLIGDTRNHLFGQIDPVTVKNDQYVVALILIGPDGYTNRFMMFNANGDTLFTRTTYAAVSDTTGAGLGVIRSLDNGDFAACGGYTDNAGTTRALLVRCDQDADTIWLRQYGTVGQYNEARGVAEYLDNGFLLTGTRLQVGTSDNTFLIRTDSLGNQIWRRQFGDDGAPGSVRMTLDSSIVTWSTYQHPTWLFTSYDMQLTKWDASGNVIWESHLLRGSSIQATDIETLPDGGFIAVGQFGFTALTRFSADGDSLWTRIYGLFNDQHHTYDVEPTSDGGFILCGSVQQDTSGPTPGLPTMFVIKTDSFGCVIPGCQNVGVQEYELGLQEYLLVSPNPAHDRVSFTLELPPGYAPQGAVHAVVLDATGRQVMEARVERSGNSLAHSFTLSPSTPSGLYYLHLRDERRWLAGSKVIVE